MFLFQTVHVSGQLEAGLESGYSCLWQGCKVFGKKSSSKCWLEKHVPTHGGKLAFPCIVPDCRARFSSQVTTRSARQPSETRCCVLSCRGRDRTC